MGYLWVEGSNLRGHFINGSDKSRDFIFSGSDRSLRHFTDRDILILFWDLGFLNTFSFQIFIWV
jgi:hypothetical protein